MRSHICTAYKKLSIRFCSGKILNMLCHFTFQTYSCPVKIRILPINFISFIIEINKPKILKSSFHSNIQAFNKSHIATYAKIRY